MQVQELYHWEAEKSDGVIIKEGGDLTDCIRFSLIPAEGVNLPQHDIVGVLMIRRFARCFQKVRFGDFHDIPIGLGWENGSNIVVTYGDLRANLSPGMFIRQWGPEDICPWCKIILIERDKIIIDKPYKGRTAKKCRSRYNTPQLPSEYLHCVVCKGFRVWMKSSDGTVLITPEDQEIYL